MPIPKGSVSVQDVVDLRPISNLSSLSRAFEKLMKIQICAFISINALLFRFQSGFTSGHNTSTGVIDDIKHAMDRKMSSILVLIDF